MNSHNAYMLNYSSAVGDLAAARDQLRRLARDIRLPESERADASAGALDLTEQMALLASAHAASMARYLAGTAAPSEALIQRSCDLAQQLSCVLAKAERSNAILTAVTEFVDGWLNLSRPVAGTSMPTALTAGAAGPVTALQNGNERDAKVGMAAPEPERSRHAAPSIKLT